MPTNSLHIVISQSVEEAPSYSLPEFNGADLIQARIVKNGTELGLSTVDLVFIDVTGQKYVAMITGKLIKMLSETINE